MSQPIIRGIQAVGAVDIKYRYNGNNGVLTIPSNVMKIGDATTLTEINTANGVSVAGFRLDGEFLRAVQQIASSVQVPVLGGGAVALTNNNRSGTLTVNATRVSTPDPGEKGNGAMYSSGVGLGPVGDAKVYDLVLLAQIQQAQEGGDSEGSTIQVVFAFCGLYTIVTFEGCTIVSVDPLGLAGNDVCNYNIQINYLNWDVTYSNKDAVDGSHSISL